MLSITDIVVSSYDKKTAIITHRDFTLPLNISLRQIQRSEKSGYVL